MATSPAFGRRANPQFASPRPRVAPAVPAGNEFATPVEAKAPDSLPVETTPAPITDMPSLDEELREWKKNRKSAFEIPWRQISLMASLCFGIASFVLPDSVNGAVDWLLYALMAVSFLVGISRRRRKRAAEAPRP
jgi:hypothetical protein